LSLFKEPRLLKKILFVGFVDVCFGKRRLKTNISNLFSNGEENIKFS
jgi:hypothetical protein